MTSEDTTPRVCHIVKAEDGYGFHLHGEKGKIGQLIKQVEEGSAAERGGLLAGDRLISVNGENVENATHQEVVAKIKENPNETRLEVMNAEAYKKMKEESAPISNGDSAKETEETEQESQQSEEVATNGTDQSANNVNAASLQTQDDLPDKEKRPRLCVLEKPDGKGYGFNLHSEKGKPGRYIRSVDEGGVAEQRGIRAGDRIIEVNGKNMEFEKHVQVVTAIKDSGTTVKLLVVDEIADDFFKKCEVSPTESHVTGPLPPLKTSLQNEDILSMDLSTLMQKSRASTKKDKAGGSDWHKRAALFNDL